MLLDTRCYLNNGEYKKNGYPPVPNILDIVLKMMEEHHGKETIKKLISINKDVQGAADKKCRLKKKQN
jgi:hypothetical protein